MYPGQYISTSLSRPDEMELPPAMVAMASTAVSVVLVVPASIWHLSSDHFLIRTGFCSDHGIFRRGEGGVQLPYLC
jgi:hypothetical protein